MTKFIEKHLRKDGLKMLAGALYSGGKKDKMLNALQFDGMNIDDCMFLYKNAEAITDELFKQADHEITALKKLLAGT